MCLPLCILFFFSLFFFLFKQSSRFIWPFHSFTSWPIHLSRVLSMFQGRLSIPSLPFCFHMSDFQLGWTVKHFPEFSSGLISLGQVHPRLAFRAGRGVMGCNWRIKWGALLWWHRRRRKNSFESYLLLTVFAFV